MHTYVCDRGAWRRPYRVGMCAYGKDKHAYVHACGLNKRAYVHACGLNCRTLRAKLTGENSYFLAFFMVNMADLGLYYVVAGDHLARCRSTGESEIGPS
jgi:hypothetical protein